MIKKILLLFLVILINSCGSDGNKKETNTTIDNLEEKKQQMIDKASKKIELLDCKDYFKTADYSSVCFTPIYTEVSSTDLGCVFRFEKVNNFDEYFDVNLTTYKSRKDSKAMYDIVLMEMKDDLDIVNNLGDIASIEKTDAIDSNKSLYIKYGNSFIQIEASRVVGTRATPCYFSNEEMIKFAKIFISEL